VDAADVSAPAQVGDRAADAQHAVIAAGGQPHRLGRLGEERAAGLVGAGDAVEQFAVGLGVGADGKPA
jgi:hypothetical protein